MLFSEERKNTVGLVFWGNYTIAHKSETLNDV